MVVPSIYRDPLSYILSYPKAIRLRVESLPEYQDVIQHTEKKGLLRKVIGAVIVIIILALIAYFSGARTFETAFWHSFILFQSVNLFDVVVLDIMIFCNSQKLRIKGTEDMVADYKNITHHVIGGFYGLVLGLVVAVATAGLVAFFA